MPGLDRSAPLQVSLDPERSYLIHFRPLRDVPALMSQAGLRTGRCIVVTDEHVAEYHLPTIEEALRGAGWDVLVVMLPPGETTKSPEHLQTIYDATLEWNIDRKTPLLALGGGVIGDLAGFAAATLLRGLPLIQLPTTLIAQVDSAIGGKTGINHPTGKNLIGAFYQPALVCADLETLGTLPEREWTSGLAEVVKHALIADPELFDFLESNWTEVLQRNPSVVGGMIYRAARIKTKVVGEDEREAGRRAILNFGHTFGHAIERVAGYGQFTHGEAVALGMRAALYLSHRLHPELPLERADRLVTGIPVQGTADSLPIDALLVAMQVDKKVEAGRLRFVVLSRIGHAYVAPTVDRKEVEAALAFAGISAETQV